MSDEKRREGIVRVICERADSDKYKVYDPYNAAADWIIKLQDALQTVLDERPSREKEKAMLADPDYGLSAKPKYCRRCLPEDRCDEHEAEHLTQLTKLLGDSDET